MKRYAAAGLAVLLCVFGVSSVWGATRSEHKFTMKFTTIKKNTSTGVKFTTNRFAYKPPPFGQKADRVSKIKFVMAKGTRTSTSGLKLCSKSKLQSKGPSGCPSGSKVGSGSATIITGISVFDPVRASVQVFAKKNGLLTYILTTQGVSSVVDLALKGNTITAPVPAKCVVPNESPAQGCPSGEAVIKILTVKILPKGKLIQTPKSCPSTGQWINKATYTYANGDTETEKSNSPCKK